MKVVQLSSKVVQRLFNAADSTDFLSRGSKVVLPFFFWLFSSAFCLHLLNSCQVVGLTNDYDKLTDAQLENIAQFTSFKDAVPGKIYEINAGLLKEEIKERPKSLVYIFANGCTSSQCKPLSVYKDYADKNGYNLYLVMSGYFDMDKTLKQNIELPLYTVDAAYYNTKYSLTYLRKFENELLGIPIESKRKDRKMDGSLFFYNYGVLDTVSFDLPKTEQRNYDQSFNLIGQNISNEGIGLRFDTIQDVESLRNLKTFVSLPVSGIAEVDEKVRLDIIGQKTKFTNWLDTLIREDKELLTTVNSDFFAWPVSVYSDPEITSYLFIVSYYIGGTAHPFTMYYSMNFDMNTKSNITFDDYFIVKSKADTSYFTEIITKAINREGIYVDNLKNTDFNIENNTISFNFDDYEIAGYAEGIIRGQVNKSELKDWIKSAYR